MAPETDRIEFQLNEQPLEYSLVGSRMRLLMPGRQTNGAFCLFDVQKPPRGSTPVHQHKREEETIYMLEGEMKAIVDGEEHLLVSGNTIILPRNVPHQLLDCGDGTARYILVCTPAGFDDFVAAAGRPWGDSSKGDDPADNEIVRLLEAAPKYGIEIIG
jgi:quercetin dioxygenase-like cupin family protein